MTDKCPVCGSTIKRLKQSFHRPEAELECPKCGFLRIDDILLHEEIPNQLRSGLCIYARRCFEEGREPETLPDLREGLKRLAVTYQNTTVAQKFTYLLQLLAKRSRFPGDYVAFDFDKDSSALAAANSEETEYIVWKSQEDGLVDGAIDASDLQGRKIIVGRGLQLTPLGWEGVQASPAPANSGRCFVAMAFEPDMSIAYDTGMKPAIEVDAGFQAVMMRDVPHTEKICDRILAEIKGSRFVVADVTSHKQNVYFEAGVAIGMNRPVIRTCRKDSFEDAKFDTRQYFHVLWANPEDLRIQLGKRILDTIGHRPR